jgi:hypothetical protein
MFPPVAVDTASVAGCSDVLVGSVGRVRRAQAEQLAAVATWADLHPATPQMPLLPRFADRPDDASPDGEVAAHPAQVGSAGYRERAVRLGAEGTPAVAEFAAVELGVLLGVSTVTAAMLLRDTLEIRHRLPSVWTAVLTGRVDVWKARKAAAATRVLSAEQVAGIETRVAAALEGLVYARAETVIEGLVVTADPAGHEQRRQAAEARRHVSIGKRPTPAGLRQLFAQSTPADIARIDAMIAYLAEALAFFGDTATRDLRRTRALVLMANPFAAALLIAQRASATQHATQTRAQSASAASEPDAEPDAKPDAESAPESDQEPEPEHQDEPEPEASADAASAVQLAAAFGRELAAAGPALWKRLRPRTVLYVHLSHAAVASLNHRSTGATGPGGEPAPGVARVEGLGPAGLTQLRDWLGHGWDHDALEVRPVLDPDHQSAVDDYQTPPAMAEALRLREPFETFPYGTTPSRGARETSGADEDHTIPYVPRARGGPPGQTGLHNLGPLGRHHHRAKTFGHFTCHQPLPGLYLWRTPSGHWYRVDHTGTHPLGRTTPAILRQRTDPDPLTPAEQHLRGLLADAA